MKKFKNAVIGLILSVALVGCSSSNQTTDSTEHEVHTKTTVDRLGNTIELPTNLDSIVSLAPSVTETLVNLGLGDNLVAVDPYSLDIEGLPQNLQTFDIMAPDVESIFMLNPDVIFGTGMTLVDGSDPFKELEELGTFVTVIPTPSNIDGIIEDILFIGTVVNELDYANIIVDEFSSSIEEVKDRVASYNVETPKSVYFETSPSPYMYTFGSNVFLSEYLDILQLENVFAEDGWLPTSEEQIVNKNPDVIFTNVSYEDDPVGNIKARVGWDVIEAVKNDNVFLIDANESSRPNEFSINALINMEKAVYGE